MPPSMVTTLCAGWELAWTADPPALESLASADWRAVRVPSHVQSSSFGLPKDALYRLRNTEAVQWMSERFWVYRTHFDVPEVGGPDEEAVLRFRGVDYLCDVWINSALVANHEGMWSWFELPLGGLPESHNELVVVLYPVDVREGLQEHLKVRFVRGWDWAPRLVTMGIWDEVEIITRKRLHVRHAWVETHLTNAQRADCVIHATLSERVDCGTIDVQLAGQTQTYPVVDTDVLHLPVRLTNPPLWWPNGLGSPRLVDLELLLRVAGRESQPLRLRTGLRSVGCVPAEGQRPQDIPLQLVVNGRRVFVRGTNWAPADCCFADLDRERYALYLRQLADAGFNLVRVWGGGLIEKEPFYELADELGLMVMQEFPLACEPVPESERFLRLLTQEARSFVPRLNHHPSIVMWTGGNEHHHYWQALDSGTPIMEASRKSIETTMAQQGLTLDPRTGMAGSHPYTNRGLQQIANLVAELDGSRPFQPTSAMEGEGDAHGSWSWNPTIGDWRMRDYDTLYDYWNSRRDHLYSEVGVESIAARQTIAYVLGTDEPSVPDPDDPVWRHHKAFDSVWPIDRDFEPNRRSNLWLDLASIDALFGRLGDLDELIVASQWMQAEGGRYIVEELRRKVPHTCGLIWWGTNEPWPNLAGNQLIDYFGRPRPVLFWMANAFKPTILSLRYEHCVARAFSPELWISHDGRCAFRGSYRCRVESGAGQILDETVGQIGCPEYRSVFIKPLQRIRLRAGMDLWVTLRLFDHTDAQVHENAYLFASDEDQAPLRPFLPRIEALFEKETRFFPENRVS